MLFNHFPNTKTIAAEIVESIKAKNGTSVRSLDRFENIGTKEEYAHYEHFLLLSQCFQKSSTTDASKCVYMRKCYIRICTFCISSHKARYGLYSRVKFL